MMASDPVTRILQGMARGMSRGAEEELNKVIQEMARRALDPQKFIEMAKAMGIDLSQMSNMMGQGQGSFDPYQILGLDKSASDQEVKDRYKELLHKLHPDKSGTPGTQYLLQLVIAAYETIKRERGWG